MTIRVEVFRTAETPPDLQPAIERGFREVFTDVIDSGMSKDGIEWQDGDYRVLAWHNALWGGIVEVQQRDILVGDIPVTVGGIGGLMTLPTMRGVGMGKAIMNRVEALICEDWGADMGMLYCLGHMVPYYESLGWQIIEREITYHQGDGTHLFAPNLNSEHAMVLPCGDFVVPAGAIDVKGRLW